MLHEAPVHTTEKYAVKILSVETGYNKVICCKIFLCLNITPWKHIGNVGIKIHIFLNLALDGGSGQPHNMESTENDWIGIGASLRMVVKRKILDHPGNHIQAMRSIAITLLGSYPVYYFY
jgi:hypothetical protein